MIRIRKGDVNTFASRAREALINHETGLDDYVELLLVQIEQLTATIKTATAQIRKLAQGHPICRLLMTLRGIGPITALLFVAVVDDIDRFPSAPRLTSYIGLTPGERSSASKTRRTGITKAGPTELRHALGQAALCIWRDKENPLTEWGQQIAYRRSKQIAFSAMTRKLAGIMYGIWKHQKPYDASLIHIIEPSAEVAMA
jgi:transposase